MLNFVRIKVSWELPVQGAGHQQGLLDLFRDQISQDIWSYLDDVLRVARNHET